MIFSILEQSLPFLPLVLGLYISYSVLKIADLATDGSFLIGAAIFGLALKANMHPVFCLGLSILLGSLIGCFTATLHNRLHPLLCGILLVFILSTLVLKIMARPNLSLLAHTNYFSIPVLSCITIFLLGSISFFLNSKIGLLLHALGTNPTLFSLSGKNKTLYRMLGLGIHSSCAALSGACTASTNGYVDISMGIGITLIALGTLISGQKIHTILFPHSSHHSVSLIFSCLGVFLYFFLLHLLLRIGLDPLYLKLVIGILLMSLLISTSKQANREAYL